MKSTPSRYWGTGIEGEWQPGSRRRVLRNKLGVCKKTEMDRLEADALLETQEKYLYRIAPDTVFTTDLICQMHRDWLGHIYEWAGRYRTVEMQKGSFRWPPASRVSQNMDVLENESLRAHTPCRTSDLDVAAHAVAVVHAEFLLVHPFRDGNGRVARWLADLMFLQAGFPVPSYHFSGKGSLKRKMIYLNGVINGYKQDYAPLATFFGGCVETRLRELET